MANEIVKKLGRPSKWTPELGESIVDDILWGAYFEDAAQKHGIAKDTLYNWIKDDTKLLNSGVTFSDAIKAAESEAKVNALKKLMEAPKNWQAYAWYLERRHREVYGRYDRIEHSGTMNINYEQKLKGLTDEELLKVRAAQELLEKKDESK